MLGAITTVAAIALAHAVVRPPASKEDGWKLNPPPQTLFERASTDQPILDIATYATSSPKYAQSTSALSMTEWLQAELSIYKSLSAGWDGEDSVPADIAHIDAASQILTLLPAGIPLPKTMLTSDGEVGLYWKNSDYLADAVIEDEGHFSLFIRSLKDGNNEIYIPSITIDSETSASIAAAFQSA